MLTGSIQGLVTLAWSPDIILTRLAKIHITGLTRVEWGWVVVALSTECGAIYTVYPKKYAHGSCFAVLCCGYTLTDFPISIRLTSLALWQSNDCPSASKATLMNMHKYFMWIHYERLHNHNKAKHNKTVCIFLGIYCTIQCGIVVIKSVFPNTHNRHWIACLWGRVIQCFCEFIVRCFSIIYHYCAACYMYTSPSLKELIYWCLVMHITS